MIDPTTELLNAVKPVDAERLDEIFPSPQRAALLEEILHGPATTGLTPATSARRVPWTTRLRGAPRRRRWLVSTLGTSIAVGACAALVFTGSAVVHPSAAVAFSTAPGGDIIATVTDPFAAQKELDAAFAAHGFAITVALVPVSPSLVGTLISTSQDGPGSVIDPLQGGTCVSGGGGGCPIGVKIPATFTGSGSITLGRPAQPGETYDSTASAFAPGEALHCSGLLGEQVSMALPVLARDHMTVTKWRENVDSDNGETSSSQIDATPPSQNYIWSADPVAPGEVSILTEPTPLPADLVTNGQRYNQGC